jgi:hypothetical protein
MKQRALQTGKGTLRTPLLVPSFSSKGFSDCMQMIDLMKESLFTPTLISAYDIFYEQVEGGKPFETFNSLPLVIIDSGGYEANAHPEFSDTPRTDYAPRNWSPEMHATALEAFTTEAPVALVTYDHPSERHLFADQIARAKAFQAAHADAPIVFLAKPEAVSQAYVEMDSLRRHVAELGQFAAIGVTEDEAGRSLIDRMVLIARLREALDAEGLETPIHVFGSLDTLLTFAYFAAGADIFDGLTWLRHAFVGDNTLYRRHAPILRANFSQPWDLAEPAMWQNNYSRIVELQDKMEVAASTGQLKHLPNTPLLQRAVDTMQARLRST